MCVCGTVVILQFAQMDPLNPKPITRDLPSGPQQPGVLIGGFLRPAIGRLSGDQLGLVGYSRLLVGQSPWLLSWICSGEWDALLTGKG